jgi:hypothetical protein
VKTPDIEDKISFKTTNMTSVSNTKFNNNNSNNNNNNNNVEDSSLLGCYAVSLYEVSKACQANQEPGLNLGCLILKMMALMSYETPGTTRPTTQRHIPEHVHLRKNFFFSVIFLIW